MSKLFTIIVFLAFVLLGGCQTRTETVSLVTPNGVTEAIAISGPFNVSRQTTVKTEDAYNVCLARQAPTFGAAQADMYCRSMTSAGGPGAYGPGFGAALPMQGGGGVLNYPVSYAGGYGAPVVIPTTGGRTVNSGVIVVEDPGTKRALEQIVASELNHEVRLTTLEGGEEAPAKK